MIVKRDTFPAIVDFTLNDNTHQLTITRVVINESNILIAKDTPKGPVVVYDQPYTSASWNGKLGTVEIADGTVITYRKDAACGCGSRLRSWNPYRNVVYSNQDPTA
jgi:hypothetical protein